MTRPCGTRPKQVQWLLATPPVRSYALHMVRVIADVRRFEQWAHVPLARSSPFDRP